MFFAWCWSTGGRAFLAVFVTDGVLSSGFHKMNLSGTACKTLYKSRLYTKCASGRGFQTKPYETGVHIGQIRKTCT